MNKFIVLSTAVVFVLLAGCANKITTKVSPQFKGQVIHTAYIVENQYTEYINPLKGKYNNPKQVNNGLVPRTIAAIANSLKSHNVITLLGPEKETYPEDIDVVVHYKDIWRWDFKDILDTLEITIIDPKSQQAVAVVLFKIGNSEIHTFPYPEAEVPKLVDEIFANGLKSQ